MVLTICRDSAATPRRTTRAPSPLGRLCPSASRPLGGAPSGARRIGLAPKSHEGLHTRNSTLPSRWLVPRRGSIPRSDFLSSRPPPSPERYLSGAATPPPLSRTRPISPHTPRAHALFSPPQPNAPISLTSHIHHPLTRATRPFNHLLTRGLSAHTRPISPHTAYQPTPPPRTCPPQPNAPAQSDSHTPPALARNSPMTTPILLHTAGPSAYACDCLCDQPPQQLP